MKRYTYFIVGGGMSADAAANGIRKVDPEGSIGIISDENDAPYDRPPLTKALWKGKDIETIWRGTEKLNVDLYLGRRAVKLDVESHQILDDQGQKYEFEKLLIATGGRPRHLPFGEEGVLYYRYLRDFRELQELTKIHDKFILIGGSFIGSEMTAALALNGKKVTLVFPETGIGGGQFPEDLSKYLNGYYREKGVEVLESHQVQGMERRGDQWVLHTEPEHDLTAEVVLAGIGIEPNTELAEEAGLDVEDGIVVDASLHTSYQDIFAAGDVAQFYNSALGRMIRVEHEDNALTMGEMAGRSMAGEEIRYDYLPYFYSDLFDLGYEAIGDLNPDFDIISDWQEPYQKGVLYYLDWGRVRGVLLWNVWKKVDAARQLINEPGPFKEEDLKGRLLG